MKSNILPAFIALVVMMGTHLPASAQTDATAAGSAPQASQQAGAGTILPKLTISWDCGECEKNEKVIPLIEQAYAAEAKSNGLTVSDTDAADAAIIDIRQRPPGVRVMFGIMAGKDRLGLRIRYKDKEYLVEDSSANILMGLNYLSASVGKKAYTSIAGKPN